MLSRVTPRISGRRRAPPQVAQALRAKYDFSLFFFSSLSEVCIWRSTIGTRPSNALI